MEQKNTVFDQIIFCILSAAISFVLMYAVMIAFFLLVIQFFTGFITIGTSFVIAGVSFLIGMLVFFKVFDFVFNKLSGKSISKFFLNVIRQQQSLVKGNQILQFPPEEHHEKIRIYDNDNSGPHLKKREYPKTKCK